MENLKDEGKTKEEEGKLIALNTPQVLNRLELLEVLKRESAKYQKELIQEK